VSARESEAPAGCIFCRIATGSMTVPLVYEDDRCIAFADVNPQAPVHVLIIPRQHIESLADVSADEALLGRILAAAAEIGRRAGMAPGGFRVVINSGPDAGQSVAHLHAHFLAGRPMSWPPG
jgi:histidine triad (HIT) family protein